MSDHQWVHELFETSGSAIGFRMDGLLHREQTPFQLIEIYQSTDFGPVMMLDHCWMVTERENFIYHEMMAHPALFTHPQPRRVGIIGGGDCGTLLEVLKHPGVERATQIEIDRRVTELSEQYFPSLTASNNDPRAVLLFEDGIAWMEQQPGGVFDVLIVDSTDPVGMAAGLYQEAFFQTCHRALSEQGILIQQSESPLLHVDLLQAMRRRLPRAGFDRVEHLLFPQPCYPSGWWSATMALKGDAARFRSSDAAERGFETRYYDERIHQSAQVLPPYLRSALNC